MFKVKEISVIDLQKTKNAYILVDVRGPQELVGPEGKIEGIISAPLGDCLSRFLASADPRQKYVFICRSGYRSAKACEIAYTCGFPNVYNMDGGMLAWNQGDLMQAI